MRYLTLTIGAVIALFSNTVAQLDCASAIQENSNPNCAFTSYIAGGTEFWAKFTAQSEYVNIQVITTLFGVNAPHIHGITLYGGTCANLTKLADDELAFFNSAGLLQIDLDASALVIGQTYYIQLRREATGGSTCPMGACFPVINPASFELCIEEIDVFIPPDMIIEPPATSHIYYKNRGQLLNSNGTPANEVKLYTLNASPAIYLGDNFTSFVLSNIDTGNLGLDTMQRVDMTLVEANSTRVFKTEQAPGVINHFLPHIPEGVTGTKGFHRAVCNNVYPLIDMHTYSNGEGTKIYFIVRPKGDVDQIELRFSGANSTNTTASNGLKIETLFGVIEFERAHVYRINPANVIVPMPASGDFVQTGPDEYKFDIQNYPTSMPLVIVVDEGHGLGPPPPTDNIYWGTYYGNTGSETAWDSHIDMTDNLLVAGETFSNVFPITVGVVQPFFGGSIDAHVVKFGQQRELKWATFYGGLQEESAYGLTTDEAGNVYFTGFTRSTNFPTQNNGTFFQGTLKGPRDATIVKLNPDGNAKLWATYFGGNDHDYGYSIDYKSPFLYVVGRANTKLAPFVLNFPLLPFAGAYNQTTHGDANGTTTSLVDVFIARFTADGTQEWTTFLGGDDIEIPTGCAVDEGGNLFVSGYSRNDGAFTCTPLPGVFPLCDPGGGAYMATNVANIDAFIAKFNIQGKLLWSTMYGSVDNERNQFTDNSTNNITVDATGNVYVLGTTKSFTFPVDTVAGAYIQGVSGAAIPPSEDLFILKFNPNGVRLWATMYGGNFEDVGTAIEADPLYQRVYISGFTRSTDLPLMQYQGPSTYYYQPTKTGNWEGFLVVLDENDTLEWATYIGGSNDEFPKSISLDAQTSGSVSFVLAGHTTSPDYPVRDIPGPTDYHDSTYASGNDVVITEFIADSGVVGMDESFASNNSFMLYPNPSRGFITFNAGIFEGEDIEIAVYNIQGAKVLGQRKHIARGAGEITLNLSSLASSTYILQLRAGEELFSYKLVKQ